MMLPMMFPNEVRALERALLAQKGRPLRILEWGSGGSTVYFTKFLQKHGIAYEWISLEYNKRWAETVTAGLEGDPHTRVVLFDVGNDQVLQRDIPMNEYVDYPRTLGVQFDFILVDGRKRRRCLIEARSLVAPSGVVVCHDAERHYYQCAFSVYPRGRFVTSRVWMGTLETPNLLTRMIDSLTSLALQVGWRLWHTAYRAYATLKK